MNSIASLPRPRALRAGLLLASAGRCLVGGLVLSCLLLVTGCALFPDKNNKVPPGIESRIDELGNDMKALKKTSEVVTRLEKESDELKKQREEEKKKVDEQVRASAAATGDVIRAIDREVSGLRRTFTDLQWEPLELKIAAAGRFNRTVESLVGSPLAANRIDTNPFYSTNVGERTVAWSKYEQKEKEAAEAQKKVVEFDGKLKTIDEQLTAKRGELAQVQRSLEDTAGALKREQSRLFWGRVWDYTKATLGIGGVIALFVFFPALIPVFGSLVSGIVRLFPASMSFFRVASKSTLENVVSGIGKAKAEIDQAHAAPAPEFAAIDTSPVRKEAGDGTVLTADAPHNRIPAQPAMAAGAPRMVRPSRSREVLKRQLAVATDNGDKQVIDHIIRKFRLE